LRKEAETAERAYLADRYKKDMENNKGKAKYLSNAALVAGGITWRQTSSDRKGDNSSTSGQS